MNQILAQKSEPNFLAQKNEPNCFSSKIETYNFRIRVFEKIHFVCFFDYWFIPIFTQYRIVRLEVFHDRCLLPDCQIVTEDNHNNCNVILTNSVCDP